MPQVTQLEEIDDFVAANLDVWEKGKFEDIAQAEQELICPVILETKKVRRIGGPHIKFTMTNKRFGNARMTGPYAQDDIKIKNILVQGAVPWRHMQGGWGYDVAEDDFSTDETEIVDMLETRDYTSKVEMWELLESELFSAPSSPSSNHMWGLMLWLQGDPSSSATSGSFSGGNPSGFSSGLAGIDCTLPENAGWKNYAANYVNASKADLITKIKRAIRRTRWKPIVPHPQLGFGAIMQEMMTTEAVCEALEDIAELRNDNHRNDVARYMDQVVVAGRPVKNVWHLTNNYSTTNPILGVDWSAARFYVHRKHDMRRTGPREDPENHNGRLVHYDFKGNLVFQRRRTSFRLDQVAA